MNDDKEIMVVGCGNMNKEVEIAKLIAEAKMNSVSIVSVDDYNELPMHKPEPYLFEYELIKRYEPGERPPAKNRIKKVRPERKCILPNCDTLTNHRGGYCCADHCKEHRKPKN